MHGSLNKQQKVFWKQEKFNNCLKAIKLVDYPTFSDNVIENIETQKRIKSDKFIYFFSKQYFIKKKCFFNSI